MIEIRIKSKSSGRVVFDVGKVTLEDENTLIEREDKSDFRPQPVFITAGDPQRERWTVEHAPQVTIPNVWFEGPCARVNAYALAEFLSER